jgi:hypothetical protein
MTTLALLRGLNEDITIKESKVVLGRQSSEESVIKISESKQMPRRAFIIYYDQQNDQATIQNTSNKVTVWVDRM